MVLVLEPQYCIGSSIETTAATRTMGMCFAGNGEKNIGEEKKRLRPKELLADVQSLERRTDDLRARMGF